MPKIIKNGLEYSGVPVEVVTAWAPTSDPVQVKEPLMGNTDISEIGDGTITGALDSLAVGTTQDTEVNATYVSGGVLSTSLIGNVCIISGNLEIVTEAPAGTWLIRAPRPFLSAVGSPLVGYKGDAIRNLFGGANEQTLRPLSLSVPTGWYYINIACILEN